MASRSILDVGWVGLGSMGFGMATNLIRRGHQVTAFDINLQVLERFAAAGGMAAGTLRDSARGKGLYVCMVASAAQLDQVMFQGETPLVDCLERGATFLVTSTVAASDVARLEERFRVVGRGDILLVDCPVSGGAKRAADGTLSIMAAGSKKALQSAMEVLSEMADPSKLFFPGEIGQGSNLKMVHQVLADVQIVANSEAFAFASYLGLDLYEVRNAVLDPSSGAGSWMFENRSLRTIEHKPIPPESSLNLVVKDTAIITETALYHRFPVPLCSAAEQAGLLGRLHGFGPDDDGTLARMYCPHFEPPGMSSVKLIQDTTEKAYALHMILSILIGIHTVAVAEALSFAHCLGLDLQMVIELVNMSAGTSSAFSEHSVGMVQKLQAGDLDVGDANPLEPLRTALALALSRARSINCPLLVANAALDVITEVERSGRSNGRGLWITDLVLYYR